MKHGIDKILQEPQILFTGNFSFNERIPFIFSINSLFLHGLDAQLGKF